MCWAVLVLVLLVLLRLLLVLGPRPLSAPHRHPPHRQTAPPRRIACAARRRSVQGPKWHAAARHAQPAAAAALAAARRTLPRIRQGRDGPRFTPRRRRNARPPPAVEARRRSCIVAGLRPMPRARGQESRSGHPVSPAPFRLGPPPPPPAPRVPRWLLRLGSFPPASFPYAPPCPSPLP